MFDISKYGLESHYAPDQHEKIRRLILEDWKASGVKLPTYMKLVARYIAPEGVPEEWLSKLRHQTMDTMLKRISVPRYEFWACLHLYIVKKYGSQDIGDDLGDSDILGQSLVRFGDIKEAPEKLVTIISDKKLTIEAQDDKLYALAELISTDRCEEPFGVEVTFKSQGAAVKLAGHLLVILRDEMTKDISTEEIET